MWIVEIEKGVWLAPWTGDPGRTLVKESAKKYRTLHGAKIAAGKAVARFPLKTNKHTVRVEEIKVEQ